MKELDGASGRAFAVGVMNAQIAKAYDREVVFVTERAPRMPQVSRGEGLGVLHCRSHIQDHGGLMGFGKSIEILHEANQWL